MFAFQYRPNVLIWGIILIFGLSFISPSYGLYESKYVFLIMTGLLVFLISIKSNQYVVNAHSLFALGIVWFVWLPFFDILFLHKYIPYVGLWETRIDYLSERDDSFIVNIIFIASIFLLSYLSIVSIISRFSGQPKKCLEGQNPHIPQIHVNYALLRMCVFALLLMYFMLIISNLVSPMEMTHWTEERMYTSGPLGYFLGNANFFLTSIVYFLILYTYKNSKISRNVKLLVGILVFEVLLFYFLDNSRIFFLAFLVGLAAVFERLGKKINWTKIMIFGVFFFGFMIYVNLRRSFLDLNFIELISLDVFSEINFFNIARKELEWYPGIGNWLTLYDLNKFEEFPYSNLGYLFKTFFFWLPSGLFSFQEEMPFTAYLGYYLTNDPIFSTNITSLGELALMFGWPVTFLFGVACGVGTYLLDIKYLDDRLNFKFLIYAVIILQIMRGPFYYFLSQIILLALAWGLIFKLFVKQRSSVNVLKINANND